MAYRRDSADRVPRVAPDLIGARLRESASRELTGFGQIDPVRSACDHQDRRTIFADEHERLRDLSQRAAQCLSRLGGGVSGTVHHLYLSVDPRVAQGRPDAPDTGAIYVIRHQSQSSTICRMPLVFAAVMPHGGALIPELDDGVNGSAALTDAMDDVAAAAVAARLDALIVADPHGLGVEDAHCIAVAPRMAGKLDHLSLELETDRDLAEHLLERATEAGLPSAGVMVSLDGLPFPIDWGLFVPAWFLGRKGKIPPVTLIVPSRSHGLRSLAALGAVIADLAEATPARVGLVASADNAHAHLDSGPYGYHPSAEVFDRLVVDLTRAGDFRGWLDIDQRLIEEALPDSPWQLAILAGACERVPFETASCVYDCPSYFGMMVAHFRRKGPVGQAV